MPDGEVARPRGGRKTPKGLVPDISCRSAASGRSVGRVHVLVCDDEPDIRLLFRVALEAAGAEVTEAIDGVDCVESVEARRPDLLVLDLYMPRRDGFAALELIHGAWPDLPVVVVSAHASVEILRTGRQLGAVACFPKPTFVSRIPSLVERFGAIV